MHDIMWMVTKVNNICLSYVILYLILYVIYTQFYKVAANNDKNDGTLTVLLQLLSGLIVLIFIPIFKIVLPTNYLIYVFLIIACIFYALSDRTYTTARRGLTVSIFSITNQLSTIFVIIFGVLFLKEPLILNKVMGALLIIFGNIISVYKRKDKWWNKYYIYSLIGNISLAVAVTIDVGISEQFNLPLYVSFTLIIPAIILMLLEKIRIKDIVSEYQSGNKKAILTVCILWGMAEITMLRAYQLGSVTVVASLCSIKTLLNVLVAHFAFKEKDSLIKKIVAAIVVVLGIVIINI